MTFRARPDLDIGLPEAMVVSAQVDTAESLNSLPSFNLGHAAIMTRQHHMKPGSVGELCLNEANSTQAPQVLLELLGEDLILRLWPPARITLGMRTNRMLRSLLKQAPEVVLIAHSDGGGLRASATGHICTEKSLSLGPVRKFCGHLPWAQTDILLGTELMTWKGVSISAPSYSAGVFHAVIEAVSLGWSGLYELDLCGNNIGASGMQKLPVLLQKCRELSTLRLDHNHITDEGAKTLAGALHRGFADRISVLSLAYNGISSEGAGVLAQSFPDAQLLSHLDLSGNGFSDEGVRVLCLALPRCKALSALHLTHNEIGVHGASSLALIIPRCSMLSTLVLFRNPLGCESLLHLSKPIAQHDSMTHLDLSSCSIGANGAVTLAKALASSIPFRPRAAAQLSTFLSPFSVVSPILPAYLHSPGLGSFLEEDSSAASAASTPMHLEGRDLPSNYPQDHNLSVPAMNAGLRRLDLRNNAIGLKGAAALSGALTCLQNLAFLDLSRNLLGDEGLALLAPGLRLCPVLKYLALGINDLTDMSCTSLASANAADAGRCGDGGLPRRLETFILARNTIGDLGAERLSLALRQSRSISSLDLRWNRVGPRGGVALAVGLLDFGRQITSLYLSSNRLLAAGASALAKALVLGACPSLCHLSLRQNSIGCVGAKAISQAFPHVSFLSSIDFSCNRIKDEGACAIATAVSGLHPRAPLSRMELRENAIGNAGALAIAEAATNLASLELLEMCYNRVGQEGLSALLAVQVSAQRRGIPVPEITVSKQMGALLSPADFNVEEQLSLFTHKLAVQLGFRRLDDGVAHEEVLNTSPEGEIEPSSRQIQPELAASAVQFRRNAVELGNKCKLNNRALASGNFAIAFIIIFVVAGACYLRVDWTMSWYARPDAVDTSAWKLFLKWWGAGTPSDGDWLTPMLTSKTWMG